MAVATAVAIGSAVVSAGMSFSQAAKQKGIIADAEAEAESKMKQARASLEKNYMESLSIPKAAFEAQNEAILVAGSAALDAARDGSQRGVGTVAQNVLNSQNDALRDASVRQEQQLFNLEAATAEEESRLRDIGVGLDLQEVEGANMVAADAQAARNAAIQSGIGSLIGGATTALAANENFILDDTTDAGNFYNSAQDITIDGNMKGPPQAPPMPYGTTDGNVLRNPSIPQQFNAAGLGMFPTMGQSNAMPYPPKSMRNPAYPDFISPRFNHARYIRGGYEKGSLADKEGLHVADKMSQGYIAPRYGYWKRGRIIH
tara:strand:+ start:1987 stop:2934 length:948 start_codon:yes stop_codon:yes gene_type:complete